MAYDLHGFHCSECNVFKDEIRFSKTQLKRLKKGRQGKCIECISFQQQRKRLPNKRRKSQSPPIYSSVPKNPIPIKDTSLDDINPVTVHHIKYEVYLHRHSADC